MNDVNFGSYADNNVIFNSAKNILNVIISDTARISKNNTSVVLE